MSAWLSNYIHYKVWDEITYPFPNFCWSLGMDKLFHPTIYWAYNYLSMMGLKLIQVKGAPVEVNFLPAVHHLLHPSWTELGWTGVMQYSCS